MDKRHDAIETAKLLSGALSFDDLSRVVLKIIRDEVGIDRGTVFVVDRERGEIRSSVAEKMRIGAIALPIGSGIAGTVAETGQIIDTEDAYEDDRFDAKFDPLLNYETRDIYCMPIKNEDGKIVGVLELLNRTRPLSGKDKEFLQELTLQLASALERVVGRSV
ncbi:MAG: GAF domain-containing protein [Acidobacteria bacterium]|nr:GAF domain-containing protein [Acidobacteriota bacterium]